MARILKCQWTKNVKQQWYNKPIILPDCGNCPDRFQCYTLKAKKYVVYEAQYTTLESEVFAVDKEAAREYYFDYNDGDKGDGIVLTTKNTDGESTDFEIKEITKPEEF